MRVAIEKNNYNVFAGQFYMNSNNVCRLAYTVNSHHLV